MSLARAVPELSNRPGAAVRVGIWVLHLALPVAALWLLMAQPELDITWQHRPSHFWLVLAVATVNVALAIQVSAAAHRRADARLLLVGHAFTIAAGFLLLHALATPGVIVAGANGGFEVATPVGLALASLFFVAASLEFSTRTSDRIMQRDTPIRWMLYGSMIAWAIVSVAELPPLADPVPERAEGPLRWVAIVSVALYLVAAIRFFRSHRSKPSVMLVALITAAVLLAEAMATIVWARSWQLSWWLWHVLMAMAFGFVAYSAYSQFRREGGSAGLFDGIVSDDTREAIRKEYGGALETMTDTLQRSAGAGLTEQDLDLIIAGLRVRFSLTEGQGEVLGRAARSLAAERDQTRRLGALAVIGTQTAVERDESELLSAIVSVVGERFSPDVVRIGLQESDGLSYPDALATGEWPDDADFYSRDLIVGSEAAGVVDFARPHGRFRERDTSIMDTLVAEIGMAVQNVRLYRQLDTLFRTYLSPDVADTLRADPSQAGLGGSMVELTALFADLRGFTSFTERTDPRLVLETLNRYFGAAVPVILSNGGTVVQFVGDALLAIFDAPRPRPDHAFRAAKAGLGMQAAIAAVAGDVPEAPRFRIGINTGVALVGNIGSAEFRSYNVVGDAVNVASRLETSGEPGTVVVGQATYELIADRATVHPLGPLELKGKSEPIVAYRLEHLRDG